MNQILDTGEEQFKNNNINYGNYNQNKKQKVYKEKSVIEINKIVIFFAISILILGICIIAGSIYAKDKINKNIEENATPVVNFNFNEDESSVDISVHHPKGITQVIYTLNNQDEKVIEGNNQQDIKTTVKLDGGKNKIVVKATDEMNHLVEYEQEYTVGNLAQIDLNNVDNAVKLTVTSVEKIKKVSYKRHIARTKSKSHAKVSYKWDDEQEKVIEVNSTQYSERITAPVGKHTLKIEVIDDKGIKTEKTQVVIGAKVPEIKVQAIKKLDGNVYYSISIKDEVILKNVKITLNDEEKVNIDVNSSEYTTEIVLQKGFDNKLIIEASNENLTTSKKAQCSLP